MSQTILAEYERRRAAASDSYERARVDGDRYKIAAIVAAALSARSLWYAIQRGHDFWSFAGIAAITLVLTILLLKSRRNAERLSRLSAWYERGLERVRGGFLSGFTGESFSEPGHLYERDLDLLGQGSIFDLLATTRTMVGQRGLARLLLRVASVDEARQRQEAVRELSRMLDLRERIALLGRYKFEDVPAHSFDHWLDAERSNFAAWIRWALILLTATWIGIGIGGLLVHMDKQVLMVGVGLLIGLQGVICLWLQRRVRDEIEAVQRLIGQTTILREGLKVMREQRFMATRLVALQHEAEGKDRALAQLEWQLLVIEQRPKEWWYLVSMELCVGTHAAISLDAWKRKFDLPMRRWLDAWAEMEALLAVGTYAAEHEENIYPEMMHETDSEVALFEAEGLTHPLLSRHEAVANDVVLGRNARFLLVSGSNMAGKSTLLRAIGANVVLAFAGAPVPARRMTTGELRMGASLAISDSLAGGQSKFLAEVERLRDLLALAREHPGRGLFLIDEIFSGTNSTDRLAAAEAVLRGLIGTGAIGALSTHDLALAKLAEIPEMYGQNVHMASPDENDPLGFDYLLKPGINRTTNALAIVRLLGLGS